MANYEVSDPTGQKFQITAPDGASQDDVLKYAQANMGKQQSAPDIGPEIAGGVSDALKSAASSVGDYLNPFSDARHASYAKQAQLPLGQALGENLSQIAGTGQALATPITAPGNVASAVATPLMAHPFQALNQAAGIDLPYDQAKSQAETALMGIRAAGAKPSGPAMLPARTPEIADLKQSYVDTVNDPAVKNAVIPTNVVKDFSQITQNDLIGRGFRPTPQSAPGTFDAIKGLEPPTPKQPSILERMQAEVNGEPISTQSPIKSVTVDDLLAARRALGKTAGERDQLGRPTTDSAAASHSMGKLDDLIEKFAPQMKNANADYAAAKAAELLSIRNAKAVKRANQSGTGGNLENTLRQEVGKIPNRGLRSEEIAARDRITNGTPVRDALRMAGKLGPEGGLSFSRDALLAAATGGNSIPFSAAMLGARKIGEMLTKRQIAQLSAAIRSRSPLAQSMPPQIAPAPIMGGLLAAPRPSLPLFPGMIPAYADQNKQP